MLAFIGGLGPTHMLFVGVVALLLFGNRLPEVARSLGRAFNEFKRGLRDVDEDFKKADQDPQKLHPPRSDAPSTGAAQREQQDVR